MKEITIMFKKISFMVFAVTVVQVKAYDLIGLSSWPTKFFGNSLTQDLMFETGLTASWFNLKETVIVSANQDTVKDTTLSVVPGFYASLEKIVYYSPTELITYRFGLRFNYGQREEAVIMNFYEEPGASPTIEVRQDVQTVRFTPYFRAMMHAEKFTLSTHLGLAIAARTFDRLKLWEKSTNTFTGQRLQPYHHALQGEAGFDVTLRCASLGYFSFGYAFLFGNAKYKRKIFNDPPDNETLQEFNDQLLVTDTNAGFLFKKPVMKLQVSSLYCGFAVNF